MNTTYTASVMNQSENLHLTAQTLANRGWPLLPLHTIRTSGHCSCSKPICKKPGKHPRTPNGLKDASCDSSLIARWWNSGDSNIGIVTGPESGLLILDVDYRHDGHTSLEELEAQNGPLPDTIEALTGGGGRHIYFNYPGHFRITNSAGKLGPGLDIRGEGGYVVAPPSLHISGRRYCWEAMHHPDDVTLADPPTWLIELVTQPTLRTHGDNERFTAWQHLLDVIPEGTRNNSLTSVAGWLRLYHPKNVVEAMLQVINLARCQPLLEEQEVSRIVSSVFRYSQSGVNGHPKAAVPRYTRNEANNA